jgi:hypothetical protein
MIIGVTATRKGLSESQLRYFREYLSPGDVVHHGDCIGGDEQLDQIAKEAGCRRVAHPCTLSGQRAFCDCEEIRDAKPPIVRNHDIVNEVQVILAFPSSRTEQRRSGTWATIRYAAMRNRSALHIIYPQ